MDENALKTMQALMQVADTRTAAADMVEAFKAFAEVFLTLKADTEEQQRVLDIKVKNALQTLTDAIARANAIKVQDGKTPKAGVDYPTKEQFTTMITGLIPKVENGKTPVAGVDFFVPTAQEIVAQVQALMDSSAIFKAIFTAPDNVINAINEGESQIKPERIEGMQKLIDEVRKKHWPPFYAGAGGSSRAPIAWKTPTPTPDGIITAFTVTGDVPVDVVADGATFYSGAGYTYSAGLITFDNPPTQYVRYR